MGFLDKIRQRSDGEKRAFSLVTAAVITVIILIVWLSVTYEPPEGEVAKEDRLSSISPWQVIKDQISEAFSAFNKSNELDISTTTASSTIPIEVEQATSTATTTNQ